MRISIVVLALLLLTSCEGVRDHTWRIRFVSDADRAAAVAIDAEIREGGCGGAPIYEVNELTMGGMPMAVPVLAPGEYGFAAVANDGTCTIIAEGCIDVVLPQDEPEIVLDLESVPGGGSSCPVGVCQGGLCCENSACEDPPLPPPVIIFPWNGLETGSATAVPELLDHPLRPEARWESVDGAMSYVVEWASCEGFPTTTTACDFTTVAQRTVTGETSLRARPSSDLTVDAAAPIGRRYGVRVGACAMPAGVECTFSEPRTIDVGRLRSDIDGDGVGDVFVISRLGGTDDELHRMTATPTGGSVETVFTGTLITAAAWVGDYDSDGVGELALRVRDAASQTDVVFLDDMVQTGVITDVPGFDLAGVGDVDGDGYADFAYDDRDRNEVRVQLGGPTFAAGSSVIIRPETGVTDFGRSIAPAGDRDGDGLADVAVLGRIAPDIVRLMVYSLAGRVPAIVGETFDLNTLEAGRPEQVPGRLTGGFDMDDDGRPDICVGLFRANTVRVAFHDRIEAYSESGEFGTSVHMGDMDGTGRARCVIGAPTYTWSPGETGRAFHLSYTGDPFLLTGIALFPTDHFARSVTVADVNGDGRDDIVSTSDTPLHIGLFEEGSIGDTPIFVFPSGGRTFVELIR